MTQTRYPKLFYFFIFVALAGILPYLTLYYEELGLSGRQIGILVGLPPLVGLFSAPLFGAIADATGRHKQLLVLIVAGMAASVLAWSLVTSFAGLAVVVFVYALFFAPTVPLVDKTVLDLLSNDSGKYGRVRLWGSVGWGLGAPLAGFIIGKTNLHIGFYLCFVFLLALVWVSVQMPVAPVSLAGNYWRELRVLVGSMRWVVFMLVVFVAGAALSVIHNYLFLYLNQLGASETWMGLSLTLATVSEFAAFYFSAQMLARWGTRGLLTAALLFLAVRLLGYAATSSAAVVIALQLLHGPTFGALWVGGVTHADRLAPVGMGATAQGIFTGVTMGLGAAFGAFVGGLLYQNLGLVAMYQWAGLSVLAALILFIVAGRLAAHRRLKTATT
ncbi:MAG: MFS transporter [Anaerolineae bacterium]